MQRTRRVAPYFAGLIAVVLIHRIQLAVESEGRKGERVGGEVFDAGVVVGPSLIAQQTGCICVVAEIEAGFHHQRAAHPAQLLLRLIEVLVGIAAGAEARRIADGEAVARVHDDLRQLSPSVDVERLFVRRRGLGRRA